MKYEKITLVFVSLFHFYNYFWLLAGIPPALFSASQEYIWIHSPQPRQPHHQQGEGLDAGQLGMAIFRENIIAPSSPKRTVRSAGGADPAVDAPSSGGTLSAPVSASSPPQVSRHQPPFAA